MPGYPDAGTPPLLPVWGDGSGSHTSCCRHHRAMGIQGSALPSRCSQNAAGCTGRAVQDVAPSQSRISGVCTPLRLGFEAALVRPVAVFCPRRGALHPHSARGCGSGAGGPWLPAPHAHPNSVLPHTPLVVPALQGTPSVGQGSARPSRGHPWGHHAKGKLAGAPQGAGERRKPPSVPETLSCRGWGMWERLRPD